MITGKEIPEDIDLDTEIVIPKIDYENATIEEMRYASQLIEMKATQKQLMSERDKEYRMIKNAQNIITEAIGDTLGNATSELTGSEVDVDNADKIVEQIGIDKIVELTAIPTDDDGAKEARLVAKEEGCNSVGEVVDTSIDDTQS